MKTSFTALVVFTALVICMAREVSSLQLHTGYKIAALAQNSKLASSTKMQAEKSKEGERRPFEFGRFVRTVGYFRGFNPFKQLFPRKVAENDSITVQPNSVLWSTEDNKYSFEWGPLDDVVMGGVSKSTITEGKGWKGVWKGLVTSANNGGFAGIRTRALVPPLDLSKCRGIVIRAKGDGQRYKCILRDDSDWNGIAWSLSFDTQKGGRTIEVKIPFSQLKPTKFAKILSTAENKFQPSSLTAIQLTLSKFEYDGGFNPSFKEGDFEFALESIKTF